MDAAHEADFSKTDTTQSESYRIMPQVIKDASFTVIKQTAEINPLAPELFFNFSTLCI